MENYQLNRQRPSLPAARVPVTHGLTVERAAVWTLSAPVDPTAVLGNGCIVSAGVGTAAGNDKFTAGMGGVPPRGRPV